MEDEKQQFRSYVFMVRVWWEDLGDGRTEWRGKAQFIPNGEICYFREWEILWMFLQKMLPEDEGSR